MFKAGLLRKDDSAIPGRFSLVPDSACPERERS
jgi:hypothetical protein